MGIQVQNATKDGQGRSLSVLKRQFISFSYGGKNIEDFDLLAVFNGGRLDKEVYAQFNDIVTEQAELDGQMFWRSNFKAGQLSFTLATDGITSEKLEDFKEWFQPGIEKELVLSEYNNRKILARVSAPPKISLLPFEKDIEVKVGNRYYSTKTSLYKGEITLDFVMDDPYWYSKFSHLDSIEKGFNLYSIPNNTTTRKHLDINIIQNNNGTMVINGTAPEPGPTNNLSAFYFSLEDIIPANSRYTISLNNSTAISSTYKNLSMGIRLMNQASHVPGETQYDKFVSFCEENASLTTSCSFDLKGFQLRIPAAEDLTFDNFTLRIEIYVEDRIQEAVKIIQEDGIPSVEMLTTKCFLANNNYCTYSNSSATVSKNNGQKLDVTDQETDTYLYYCGTARSFPEISFDIGLVINSDSGIISFPELEPKEIAYLEIGTGNNLKQLKFTLPSLFTSYNQALEIAKKYSTGNSVLDLRKELRDNIYNTYTRNYIMALIDIAKNDTDRTYVSVEGALKSDFYNKYFVKEMKKFLVTNSKLSCVINCKTGQVNISTTVKQYNGTAMEDYSLTENAGNMIKSNYLSIDTRKLPENGFITANQCLMVTTNTILNKLKINYKYMYL